MNAPRPFGDDPAAMARRWVEPGRGGAPGRPERRFAGKPVNEPAITPSWPRSATRSVQLGGGIRDLDTVERYLDDGWPT